MPPKKPKEYPDKRVYPRVPMMVKVRDADTGKEEEYFSKEISCGGLFLETKNPYKKGKILQVEFQIPGTQEQVRVKAKVVHEALPGDKGPVGMGLSFIDMDGHSESSIAAYVEKLENIRKKLSS